MKSNRREIVQAASGVQPEVARAGATARALTADDVHYLVARLGAQAQEDIAWSENVKEPVDSEAFALEAIFVIANSGMRHTVAQGIFKRCVTALTQVTAVYEVFKHPGKAAAIEKIWADRDELFNGYLAASDKLAYLEGLPWIGPITKYHLAKGFGADVAKPDLHLQRMANRQGCTVDELCRGLAAATGYRTATIDVILWRAAATGVMDSRSGRFTAPAVADDSAGEGLFTGLLGGTADFLDGDGADAATCTGCGCTDDRACEGGCYWVSVDRKSRTGVCSHCSP